jgi:hypothetical protein
MGALDCAHITVFRLSKRLHGQFKSGRNKWTSRQLEAWSSNDLYIHHAYFGSPGAMNDLNVMHNSPIFDSLTSGNLVYPKFTINGHDCHLPYLVVDGIYPPRANMVKTISYPKTDKEKHFAKRQESIRKMIERAFGVLRMKFRILQNLCLWDSDAEDNFKVHNVVLACIILHNMVIRFEGGYNSYEDQTEDLANSESCSMSLLSAIENPSERFQMLIENTTRMQNSAAHLLLRNDLVEHLWAKRQDV